MTLITDAWQALGGRGMAPPESYEAVCEEAKRWSYDDNDTRTMEQMITDVLKQYLNEPSNHPLTR